jgi:hypothetical protein
MTSPELSSQNKNISYDQLDFDGEVIEDCVFYDCSFSRCNF